MIALRGLQRVTSLASGTSIRTASKSYSSSARRRQNSPFLGLFARHKDHQSAKHLLLRRRQYSAQTEFPKTPSPKQSVPDESNKSWSQRFKDLSRKYGWAAVGTYFALSILDYPFFFLAVRSIGAERIGHYEHAVLEWINATLPFELPRIRWPWQKQTVEGEEVGVASTNSDPKTSASGSVGKKEGASKLSQAPADFMG
ncbi:MAG: hypothetical protein LQ340_000873 [Diploschistes diacapsis]|nr:MAG: hypothetical protein LQ340_000873 [Diploschistes diacapsis]